MQLMEERLAQQDDELVQMDSLALLVASVYQTSTCILSQIPMLLKGDLHGYLSTQFAQDQQLQEPRVQRLGSQLGSPPTFDCKNLTLRGILCMVSDCLQCARSSSCSSSSRRVLPWAHIWSSMAGSVPAGPAARAERSAAE